LVWITRLKRLGLDFDSLEVMARKNSFMWFLHLLLSYNHLLLVFRCSTRVDKLPFGIVLLEETLTFIRSVDDKQKAPHQNHLLSHIKDLLPL